MLSLWRSNLIVVGENQDTEFAWFESVQGKLTAAFLKEGYSLTEARELGFFVAQAVRNVPALLRLLEEAEGHTNDEIVDAIHAVLSSRSALHEAARILSLEG